MQAKARILIRLKRMIEGNPGNLKPIDSSFYEMRIHVGKGYRVHYIALENVIIVLVCGGDKSSQRKDIERVRNMAAEARRDTLKKAGLSIIADIFLPLMMEKGLKTHLRRPYQAKDKKTNSLLFLPPRDIMQQKRYIPDPQP